MPNPVVGMMGASMVVGAYGANQQAQASGRAIDAQTAASEAATAESARQFDLVREDTRISRETGDQAMLALGFLMGTRQPPSDEAIGQIEAELAEAQALRAQYEARAEATPQSTQSGGFAGRVAGGVVRGIVVATQHRISAIDEDIAQIQARLDAANQERNMAMEMGGGMGRVPDLNALFDGVDLPTGDNIGSPDSYLPDLDSFLQGLGEDLENSAGYQFEMKQGREALQSSLTQKGTAYGGNAMKEALMFSQDYASTKYGERHSQAMQEYDRTYQAGMTRYGMDLDTYNRDRQGALDQYGLNMDRYRLEREQDDTHFARLATMSGYGPAGTQISANAGQNYAQTVAQSGQNLASTIGNAAYAQAGANTQAVSNIANAGMTMYQYNQMMRSMNQGATA